MENKSNVALWILGILLALSLVALFVVANKPAPAVPSAQAIAALVTVPSYNDSAVKAQIADVKAIVGKDDAFKAKALDLALADIQSSKCKDLFNFMSDNNISIDEKSDIDYFLIKDSSVSISNVDKENGVVSYELKVYYENSEGDNKKVLVDVETTIKDGEVDSTEYSLG